jgi:hypothetical protein
MAIWKRARAGAAPCSGAGRAPDHFADAEAQLELARTRLVRNLEAAGVEVPLRPRIPVLRVIPVIFALGTVLIFVSMANAYPKVSARDVNIVIGIGIGLFTFAGLSRLADERPSLLRLWSLERSAEMRREIEDDRAP